jgi:hypothetical protein
MIATVCEMASPAQVRDGARELGTDLADSGEDPGKAGRRYLIAKTGEFHRGPDDHFVPTRHEIGALAVHDRRRHATRHRQRRHLAPDRGDGERPQPSTGDYAPADDN